MSASVNPSLCGTGATPIDALPQAHTSGTRHQEVAQRAQIQAELKANGIHLKATRSWWNCSHPGVTQAARSMSCTRSQALHRSKWRLIVPSDIHASRSSTAAVPNTPPHGSTAPTSASSDIAQITVDDQQTGTEEKVLIQKIDKLAELRQELSQLNQKLSGNLSTYSRVEVVQMSERAQIIEQQLETLQNPEKARTDAPGL